MRPKNLSKIPERHPSPAKRFEIIEFHIHKNATTSPSASSTMYPRNYLPSSIHNKYPAASPLVAQSTAVRLGNCRHGTLLSFTDIACGSAIIKTTEWEYRVDCECF